MKALTILVIIFSCIVLFPLTIGLIGGVFGLIGGLFGLVFGLIGGIFGMIGTIFGALFHVGVFALIIIFVLAILIRSGSQSKK